MSRPRRDMIELEMTGIEALVLTGADGAQESYQGRDTEREGRAHSAAGPSSCSVPPRSSVTAEQTLEDAELVLRVSQRDAQAFEILYQRYHTPLRRFISRVDRRVEQDVEEVINDVMLVVWQKAATFNGTSKVSTWIMGIAYRKAMSAGSQRSGAAEVDYDDVADTLPGIADQGLQDYELQDWLRAALERLSPDQRAVMELTCNEGLHYGEIAEILGCPENTVKTRMFHSRRKLRQVLDTLGTIGD